MQRTGDLRSVPYAVEEGDVEGMRVGAHDGGGDAREQRQHARDPYARVVVARTAK